MSSAVLHEPAPLADDCTTQDYMHADRYYDLQHHVNVTTTVSCQTGMEVPAFVSVETTIKSMCGGTMVSIKMNGLLSHVQKAWRHSTSTPTAPSAGTV